MPVRPGAHGRAMRTTSERHVLSARLDHDWRALARRPDAVAQARSWGVTEEPFEDLDELLGLLGFRTEHTPAQNERLLRVVELGRHDDLAARVVLQRVLPGLLAIIGRRRRAHDGSFEELVGAAWLSIRACRTDGERAQIAANVVRDAAYRAFVAPTRRRSATEIAVDPHTLEETPDVRRIGPCEELATLLADARQFGVPYADLALVRDLVVVGSPGRVAALREVTPRTVRNHRDRITARLRRVALSAA
jgi:hypothetical protein